PESLAARVDDDRPAAGGLAGDCLRWGDEAGRQVGLFAARSGRIGRGANVAQNRRGGTSGERFPGVIDPVDTKGLIEPEQGLARLLPELFWLERRNARTRHEWCFNL